MTIMTMEAFSGNYSDIKQFEVELNSFSGEGLKVKFDLAHRLISWNDGYMWNNNFMKAINDEKLEMLNERLPETHMLEWMYSYKTGCSDEVGAETANPGIWRIEVVFEDGEIFESGARKHFPNDWRLLKTLIEDITECSFRLR